MDRYSRLVRWLKVLLPLAALALLSTLFLLSRAPDQEATIPFAKKDMVDRMRDQRITAPVFSGTTDNGDELIVTAATASPAIGDKPADAQDLSARITTPEGLTISLTADRGTLVQPTDTATFAGNVVIETSTGYVVETHTLNTQLGTVTADTPGEITGSGPLGSFAAGQMQMESKNETGDIHMLFKNGVKLIYDPKLPER